MRRILTALAITALVLVEAQPAAALTKTSATWTHMNDGAMRTWHASTFVPTTCRLVTFGGSNGSTLSSTALFDPAANTWSTIAGTRTSPAAQSLGAIAWDPAINRVVLFGGRTSRAPAIQETWAFDPVARSWAPLITRCTTGSCPPARYGHQMAWSARAGKLVLFGGIVEWTTTSRGKTTFQRTIFDDLWTYDGTWTKVAVTGPRPTGRFLFGMAEDAATGKIVVYGGVTVETINGTLTYHGLNDTWLLDPTTMTWTKVTTPTTPTSFGEIGMGWAPSIGAIVQTGGSDWQGLTNPNPGTWAFDMTARTWVKLTTNAMPSARKNATLVGDTCHASAILYGGEDGIVPLGFTDNTWVLR